MATRAVYIEVTHSQRRTNQEQEQSTTFQSFSFLFIGECNSKSLAVGDYKLCHSIITIHVTPPLDTAPSSAVMKEKETGRADNNSGHDSSASSASFVA